MHHLFHINSRLREQALFDDLTKLLNRRYFHQQLFLAQGDCHALILLDLDHFKQINDNYGHDIGDRVLKQFGELLQQHSPPGALAARVGGEEFALLAATRTIVSDLAHPLTVSLGVGIREPGEPAASLFKRVDQALYGAKAAGRNSYMWAPPDNHGEG